MKGKALAAGLALAATLPLAAQAATPITLRFSFPGSPVSTNLTKGLAPWAHDVEAASGGTVKIQIFPGSTIASTRNTYDRLLNNVVDIGYAVSAAFGGVFKGTSVVALPFLVHDIVPGSVALWNLYADGTLAKEYSKVRPLELSLYPGDGLHTKIPVRRLEDLKGFKMGVEGAINADIMDRLGAVPVTLTTTENFQALQRGVVQGVMIGWTGVVPYHLIEVTSYHLDMSFGTVANFTLMSKASYARLPATAKAAFDEYSGEPFSRRMGVTIAKTAEVQENQVRHMAGQHILTLDPKEQERWVAAATPVVQQWIKTTPNGAEILAAFKAELKKAGDK